MDELESRVGMAAVRYLYLCPDHGELASTLIDAQTAPPDRCCTPCLAYAEVWGGSSLQRSSPTGVGSGSVGTSARAKRRTNTPRESRQTASRSRSRRPGRGVGARI